MNNSADESPVMYVGTMDAYLNCWFAIYEEARSARQSAGGYLFPYPHHFFIARAEAVRELGLDPSDPDWERIGWDWVQPLDLQAWRRLKETREAAV